MFLAPLMLALVTQVQANAVFRFAQGLTSSHIRTFTPYAANADDLAGDRWLSVRNFFTVYDCIDVRSYRIQADGDWLVADIDGSGTTRNAKHARRDFLSTWYLRVDDRGAIEQAMSEVDYATEQLIRAQDDNARRAIVDRYDSILPRIAKNLAELTVRTDRARTTQAVTFLIASIDDPETEAYAWSAMERLAKLGSRDAQGAIKYADLARMYARRVDSCDLHAYTEYIAAVASERDDLQRQGAILDPIIAESDALDDPAPALRGLNTRAGNLYEQGDIGGAYRLAQQLSDLSARYEWPEGQLLGWHDTALIESEMTQWQDAIAHERHTAALAHEILNKEFEARSCNIIGQSYAFAGEYQHAIPWEQRALNAAPRSLAISAIYHVNLGIALVKTGRVREADAHLPPALEMGRAANYIVNAYELGARVRRAQGRYAEAMEFARTGIGQEPNGLFKIWELKAILGQMLIECGDVDAGIDALRESIDLIEARRALSTSDAMIRAHYFATRQWVYATLLEVLFDRKEYAEALAVAEQMKARSLDDSLFDRKAPEVFTADEQKRLQDLNQSIVDLNREVIVAHGAKELEARKKLLAARSELAQFSDEVALRHTQSVEVRAAIDPADLVTSWHGPAVIEYALLPDAIVAFVVRNGRVTGRKLPRAGVEEHANRLLRGIEQRDLEFARDARRLHNALLTPVADLLPKSGTLYIVPDGFLWRVPFDALRSRSKTFVAEQYSIAYAPSLVMLARARQHRRDAGATRELLAFGDPAIGHEETVKIATNRGLALGALPDAGREVRALANLYGRDRSTVLTGSDATESALKKLIGNYRIVHLATHGIVDDASPLYSALVLATSADDPDDGLLEMREMNELRLHADLVVLSGCDTARGDVYPGEGVIGMSWALLTSGCPTTVVSQWTAPSRSTAKLMIEFHRRLIAGETKADALRHARLALLHDPAYQHPFYWAPFVVIGDGTSRLR